MASRTEVRVFSLREADSAIAELKKTLPVLRTVLRDVETAEVRLEILELICNRSVTIENPDLQEYLNHRVKYHRTISKFEEILRRMEGSGYLLRDLEKGVIHFLSRRQGRSVLLCWREGEDRVSHWHALESNRLPKEEQRQEIDSAGKFE
jgi:hypothetical protein